MISPVSRSRTLCTMPMPPLPTSDNTSYRDGIFESGSFTPGHFKNFLVFRPAFGLGTRKAIELQRRMLGNSLVGIPGN